VAGRFNEEGEKRKNIRIQQVKGLDEGEEGGRN
jgi:hypothetical protein